MKLFLLLFLSTINLYGGFFYQPPTGFIQNSKSLQFTGSSSAVDCGHEAALEFEYNQKWAVSLWFKAPTGTVTNCQLVGQMRNDASDFRGWRLRLLGTTLTMDMTSAFGSALYNRVTATLTGATNKAWHHIAVNFPNDQNANNMEIYYDGAALTETVVNNGLGTNTIVNASAKFSLGSMDNSIQYCSDNTINIDDVQIYGNHAFTSDNVATLYNQGRGGTKLSTTLTSWFKLGEAGDTTASVVDSAGGASGCTYSLGNNRDFERDVAPSGFNPRQIDGALAWFDATDLNGNGDSNTGYSDGNDVSGWKDKIQNVTTASSLSHDLPVYKTAIKNSLPIVRFDGTDDCLQIADTSDHSIGANGLSFFSVIDVQALDGSGEAGRALFGKDDDTTNPGACDAGGATCQREYGALNGGSGEINWYIKCDLNAEPDPQIRKIRTGLATGWRIFSLTHDGTNSASGMSFYQNLTNAGSTETLGTCTTTQLNGTWPLQIGCRNRTVGSGESWADMDLAEFLIYRKGLTEAEIYQLNEYFNNKWAIY